MTRLNPLSVFTATNTGAQAPAQWTPSRRRVVQCLWWAVPLGGLGWLGGCASLGGPTVFTLGESELQALVGRAFPQQRRVLELLELELRLPSLRLLPEQNRLALTLALDGRDRLSTRSLQGALSFDTALRWEPSDQTLRLTQVRVQRLSLGLAPSAPLPQGTAAPMPPSPAVGNTPAGQGGLQGVWAERLGQGVVARLLDDLVIYRLSPERRAELARLGVAPSAVTVTARGVEFTLTKPDSAR